MGAPSRRPEIRRRRTRKEKIALLHKRYAAASSQAERDKILEKLRRVSPGFSLDQFLKSPATGPGAS